TGRAAVGGAAGRPTASRASGGGGRRSVDKVETAARKLVLITYGSYAGAPMTSTTSTPHDALFKGLLGKPEHARGVLREVVPAVVAEAIDWQTLTSVPGNFVDLELGQQFTDLLFSARWRDGSELLAYLLFEHFSSPPKTKDGPMAFRLLRYQVRIWEDWFSRNPEAKTLPVIIPVVM